MHTRGALVFRVAGRNVFNTCRPYISVRRQSGVEHEKISQSSPDNRERRRSSFDQNSDGEIFHTQKTKFNGPRNFQCDVAPRNLILGSGKFSKHEGVLEQKLIHATHPHTGFVIRADHFIAGGSGGDYDGVLSLAHAPSCAFMHARPESDGIIFPFSRYPRSVLPGEEISLCLIDMKTLIRDEYLLFYNRTDRVLVDPRFSPVAQSQVVFVHADSANEIAFASRYMAPVDKRRNSILFYDDDVGWSCATRFLDVLSHSVIVGFLGGLNVLEMGFEQRSGRKLAQMNGRFHCTSAGCQFSASSTRDIKDHYRGYHAGLRFPCREGCGKSFSHRSASIRHANLAHDKDIPLFKCRFNACRYETVNRFNFARHVQKHRENRKVYKCDKPCLFVTHNSDHLKRHQRSRHEGVVFLCNHCNFKSMYLASVWRHVKETHSMKICVSS